MIVTQYRVKDTVLETLVEFWALTTPTETPDGHAIDPAHTAILKERQSDDGIFTFPDNNIDLEDYKELKCNAIDFRTKELIGDGFVFDSIPFSLSQAAQMRLCGINQVRERPEVTYPIRWNSRRDEQVYNVASANSLVSMFLTGLGTYRAHVDSGTDLKDQVRAATTKAEVDAIVDPR